MSIATALKSGIPQGDCELPGFEPGFGGAQILDSEPEGGERLSRFWKNLSRGQKNWEHLCQEFKLWGAARPDSVDRAFSAYHGARNYLLERFDLVDLSDAFIHRAKQLMSCMQSDDTPAEIEDRMLGLSSATKPLVAEVLRRAAILSEIQARSRHL